MNFLKRIKHFYLSHFKPLKYAEKVGVNFPRGGFIYMVLPLGEANHG